MSQPDYLKISGLIFLAVGLLHAWRAFQGWALIAGPYVIPMWVSWVAAAVLILLAFHAFYFANQYKHV